MVIWLNAGLFWFLPISHLLRSLLLEVLDKADLSASNHPERVWQYCKHNNFSLSYPVHHFIVEEGRVHGGDEHGEADEEEAEDGHELAEVDEQARDDDRPGAEHVVELQEVKNLDHSQEEWPR